MFYNKSVFAKDGIGTDPLVAVPLPHASANASGTRPAQPQGLFAGVDHDQVSISSISASRRGHDLMVYLRSVADREVEVDVRLPVAARAAYVATTLERELRPIPVTDMSVRVPVPANAHIAVVVDAEPLT